MTRRRRSTALLAVVSAALLTVAPAAAIGKKEDKLPKLTPAQVADVTATTATVRAKVNTGGVVATYAVEWGPAGGASARTAEAPLPAANGNQDVAVALQGLTPGTAYVARLVATNAAGTQTGADVAFATAAAPAVSIPARPPAGTTVKKDKEKKPAANAAPATPAPDLQSGPVATATDAVIGKEVVVGSDEGVVKVKVPGADGYSVLGAGAAVPVGSVVDATRGTVRLTSAVGDGTQDALLRGARFAVRQDRSAGGMTDLVLRGGDFTACRAGAPVARSAATRRRAQPRRSLWAKDQSGRFRTHGRNSVATVRGTEWTTTDTCAGTTTRVREGAVVVRERRGGRRVLVRAGHSHLARARR